MATDHAVSDGASLPSWQGQPLVSLGFLFSSLLGEAPFSGSSPELLGCSFSDALEAAVLAAPEMVDPKASCLAPCPPGRPWCLHPGCDFLSTIGCLTQGTWE